MNVPNTLSLMRIFLAPVFYLLIKTPSIFASSKLVVWILLVLLFLAAEISDILDGYLARKLGQVSAIGKILDPFSDVVTHLTYFFCFVISGIVGDWAFILFVFRELLMILMRMVLLSEGTALAASSGGKLKSLLYAIGSGLGLLVLGNRWMLWLPEADSILTLACTLVVSCGLVLSYLSFASYGHKFLNRKKV